MSLIEFGEKARHEEFLMDRNVVYVNHASYGPCPRFVYGELQRIRTEQERSPDRWFRLLKQSMYIDSIRAAANRLDCQYEQIAIVENATVGINAILKSSLPRFVSAPGGTILCTNLAYGSVLFTIQEAIKKHGMTIRSVDIQLPIKNKQEFIQRFEDELNKGDIDNIRLAVIDHITSATAILFPIEEITQLFHNHGIPVVVDGAHGPGQIYPLLSLNQLTCDFYIGTFHKWMYAARGCSFLFVRDTAIANRLEPGNTSWGYRLSASQLNLMSRFHWQFFHQGTRDDSSLLTVSKAFDFIDSSLGGFDRIYQYNSTLSVNAKVLLEQHWKTSEHDLAPLDMQAPFLKMIRLPDLIDYKKTDDDALRLINDLIEHHGLVTIIVCVQNELYIRIATQIYNCLNDYQYLAETIDRLRKD
jgi:selenocysteine lyase/cysteine desulfurase